MDVYARFFRNETGLDFLADLYAFGAATSYSFVFLALIALRLNDPLEPAQVQDSVEHPDARAAASAPSFRSSRVIGFIGIVSILVFTLFTHPIGRIAGPTWLIVGIIAYFIYRRHRGLPLFGSQKHDWRKAQVEILRNAGELELMDEYVANVKASDERRAEAEAPDDRASAAVLAVAHDRSAARSSSFGSPRSACTSKRLPGFVLGFAMIALGVHRLSLIARMRRGDAAMTVWPA